MTLNSNVTVLKEHQLQAELLEESKQAKGEIGGGAMQVGCIAQGRKSQAPRSPKRPWPPGHVSSISANETASFAQACT